ncbi:hypothetical protein A2U01_0076727, partial [Trifolium medium]|nr:hypothetical protein [Trifolium medium]
MEQVVLFSLLADVQPLAEDSDKEVDLSNAL